MWFFHWISRTFNAAPVIFAVDGIALSAFLLAALLAFFCKEKSIFSSLSAIIAGTAFSVVLAANKSDAVTALGACGLLIAFGFGYLAVGISFSVRIRVQKRRAKREEVLRKLKFTLPDKDNDFIRARLNTTLSPTAKAANASDGEKKTFRLEHARQLLEKVKNAPLSKAERMEAEELSNLFYAYLKKSKWTAEDIRLLNEMFAYLLKLSAKYSV